MTPVSKLTNRQLRELANEMKDRIAAPGHLLDKSDRIAALHVLERIWLEQDQRAIHGTPCDDTPITRPDVQTALDAQATDDLRHMLGWLDDDVLATDDEPIQLVWQAFGDQIVRTIYGRGQTVEAVAR